MKNKAVFLDRDGVINPEVYNPATGAYESPHSPAEFAVYPRALKAMRLLKNAGFKLIVVSNQPSYAKGKTSLENIKEIERLLWEFSKDCGGLLDECYYCCHHPDGIVPEYSVKCLCRKPGTLFPEQAVRRFGLDASRCYMIGDRDTDILCGAKMGFTTIKINNPRTSAAGVDHACEIAADVYEAALYILQREGEIVG